EIIIRKARGSPLTIAKVPFAITSKGLKVYTPPNLETIPAMGSERDLEIPCSYIRKKLGRIRSGSTVYISYPVDARPYNILMLLSAGLFLLNKVKVLVFSYNYPGNDIWFLFMRTVKRILGSDINDSVVKQLRENIIIKAFNPSSFSIEELFSRSLEQISAIKPDIIIMLGIDYILECGDNDKSRDFIRNISLFNKKMGITTIMLGSHDCEHQYLIASSLSNIIVRITTVKDENSLDFKWMLYVWPGGDNPFIMNADQLERCIREIHTNVGRGAYITNEY
ncbi:MAG: hypothetical protein F7B59_06750, partial [Desulfurococcales archaeon]|nr:hypothetical protein [Desulfurococcales archaeon]